MLLQIVVGAEVIKSWFINDYVWLGNCNDVLVMCGVIQVVGVFMHSDYVYLAGETSVLILWFFNAMHRDNYNVRNVE